MLNLVGPQRTHYQWPVSFVNGALQLEGIAMIERPGNQFSTLASLGLSSLETGVIGVEQIKVATTEYYGRVKALMCPTWTRRAFLRSRGEEYGA
jgi:ribosomal protein L30/L7E